MANVILTSDDFGMSTVYNKEMLRAIQEGWLSSISVMVERNIHRQRQQVEALMKLYALQKISLGLHLEVNPQEDIYNQCLSQWQKFNDITGHTPDYVDIHKDHLYKNVYDVVAAFCLDKRVPFRKYKETSVQVKSPFETLNASYLELDEVLGRIATLKRNEPIEIVFHIGSHDEGITSSLNKERENDMHKLQSVFKEVTTKGIRLINYKML